MRIMVYRNLEKRKLEKDITLIDKKIEHLDFRDKQLRIKSQTKRKSKIEGVNQ